MNCFALGNLIVWIGTAVYRRAAESRLVLAISVYNFRLGHANAIPITAVADSPEQMGYAPGLVRIDRQTNQPILALLLRFTVNGIVQMTGSFQMLDPGMPGRNR